MEGVCQRLEIGRIRETVPLGACERTNQVKLFLSVLYLPIIKETHVFVPDIDLLHVYDIHVMIHM